ncbi:MAG TPA: SWIM zinc finger family protein [Planctomycetaceae bacterium]|nr:SWIM zinc finger family protein [Planctomycetaceae bacterium]
MSWGWSWKPYVPVARRREKARRHAEKLARKGRTLQPVAINGRTIAKTFWGQAWCDNLESYSDFANRLPRGRTYVRNGSVIDLQISGGQVTAIVSGSGLYNVRVDIAPLPKREWTKITRDCARSIDSLMDLLAGRFSKGVMERLTRQSGGLFPQPQQIKLRCSCPDWATLCKHVAAVLYGVGARLDHEPELLFVLRQVEHLELVARAADTASLDAALGAGDGGGLAGENLGELFGIELDAASASDAAAEGAAGSTSTATRRRRKRSATSAAAEDPAPATRPKSARSTAGRRTSATRQAGKQSRSRKPSPLPAKASAARSRQAQPDGTKSAATKSAKPKHGTKRKPRRPADT